MKVILLSWFLVNMSSATLRFPETSSDERHETGGDHHSSNLPAEGKQFGGGGPPGAAFGIPGYGKVTSYSKTPLGGHYTYVNQGPGYSHKKYHGYGAHPIGNKQVEVNEIHRPGFHGGYKAYVVRPTPRPILLRPPPRPFIGLGGPSYGHSFGHGHQYGGGHYGGAHYGGAHYGGAHYGGGVGGGLYGGGIYGGGVGGGLYGGGLGGGINPGLGGFGGGFGGGGVGGFGGGVIGHSHDDHGFNQEFETGRTGSDFGTQFRSPQQSLDLLQQYGGNNNQYDQYSGNNNQYDQYRGNTNQYDQYSGNNNQYDQYSANTQQSNYVGFGGQDQAGGLDSYEGFSGPEISRAGDVSELEHVINNR